jgi:cytochrome c oxidase subunit I+III
MSSAATTTGSSGSPAPDSRLSTPRDPAVRTWSDAPGWRGWLCTVDHKRVGRRFIATAFGFFVAGGVLAALMRLQLARADSGLIGPDLYNQLFTMHGTTMMFLFAVPVMLAVAVYFVPLLVGARNTAFPRMVAYAYWVYLFGGLMLFAAFLLNIGPDVGWFAYTPLSGPEYSPGKRTDFWAQLVTFTEVSALLDAIAIITTVLKLRAPGMTLDRIPVFAWSMLVVSFMILIAMPAVMLASTGLISDRLVGTNFYNPAEGGDPLLWQHLFWFFGHPEVYLIFLPALGMISQVVPPMSRRPMFGYPAIVLSMVATGFLSFGLWVHHMFASSVPELGKTFFTAASIVIAIPTGVQIFCWLATLWMGRLHMRTPLLFVLGFFAVFTLGGLTGVMLASVSLDLQLHDTFFVVAHLHYVLIGGAVFPLFAVVFYWFPKVTGRMLSESLGKLQFWLFLVGFNVAFFPMHILGLQGMPRRIYTYAPETGWEPLNLLATAGALVIAASVAVFFVNVVRSLRSGEHAGANPWGAGTLEWATDSPPQPGNFHPVLFVRGREPLWEQGGVGGHVTGLAHDQREVLVTSVLDAAPDHRSIEPSPTIWPFVSAVATAIFFIGTIFTPWAVVWGTLLTAVPLTLWFWPSRKETAAHQKLEKRP